MKELTAITISQWFKNGDHPNDKCKTITSKIAKETFLSEGSVVRYFRHPSIGSAEICKFCGNTMHNHGFIDYGNSGWNVCPGDYIIQTDAPSLTIYEYFPTKAIEEIWAGMKLSDSDIRYLSKRGKVPTTLSLEGSKSNELMH